MTGEQVAAPKPLFLTEFPTNIMKCPLHRCYIQKHAAKDNTVRTRYCPRCDYVRLELAKREKAANPTSAPKVRLMKI